MTAKPPEVMDALRDLFTSYAAELDPDIDPEEAVIRFTFIAHLAADDATESE